MCNNRCVFCVSGQRTEQREAFPVLGDPVIERLRDARGRGIEKVTLLGGEPTIQPDFLRIVRSAVDLGFREIVIFTNGVKTARAGFVDEILGTGGTFTFRLSFQGATGRAHDRTTKKLGSFERLVETMRNLRARSQRITVNMCVVRSNYESVESFPALLQPFGVEQLHLDMIRPLDAGVRTEDEMRAMLPRYSDMVPHLERMVAGFPAGFDVNIGNLPYCIAPSLAPVIHHDGQTTLTVAVDHADALSEPWDKYLVKRRDKLKIESCSECVFNDRCSGIFDTYARFYGTEELVPVTRHRLKVLDPEFRLFTLHAQPWLDALRTFDGVENVHIDSHQERVHVRFADFALFVQRPGGGIAGSDAFSLHVPKGVTLNGRTLAIARSVFERLVSAAGARVLHDLGPLSEVTQAADWRIGRCLERLRRNAPFGALRWEGVTVANDGRGGTVALRHDDGTGITLKFAVDGDRVRAGYELDRTVDTPSPTLVDGVRAAMTALRG
jgi:MoaA/NifB/PqqE/SkfB family radical SAM enzyme